MCSSVKQYIPCRAALEQLLATGFPQAEVSGSGTLILHQHSPLHCSTHPWSASKQGEVQVSKCCSSAADRGWGQLECFLPCQRDTTCLETQHCPLSQLGWKQHWLCCEEQCLAAACSLQVTQAAAPMHSNTGTSFSLSSSFSSALRVTECPWPAETLGLKEKNLDFVAAEDRDYI